MKIDATTFAKLPEHLQALFDKAPNPGRDEVVECFPMTKSGKLTPEMNVKASTGWSGGSQADRVKSTFEANTGSAARFFYCAKASKRDRSSGMGFEYTLNNDVSAEVMEKIQAQLNQMV